MEPVIQMPGEGERIGAAAAVSVMKAVAATTGGGFTMAETVVAAGFAGPPLHLHRRMHDSFFVLEGTIRVTAGERTADLPAGGYALIPPGVPHTFANPGDREARVLNITTPGGWEAYLRDLAAAMPADGPPDPDAFRRAFERHDVETVDPAAPAPARGDPAADLGRAFAEALVRKDWDAVGALLHPEIDFRGMTPRRSWDAGTPAEVVDGVLRHWFEDTDDLEELLRVETDVFSDRHRVAFRMLGRNAGGAFVVEDQAYYAPRDGRIGWMRVMCSGFRPA